MGFDIMRTTITNLMNHANKQHGFGANFHNHPTLVVAKECGMGHLLLYNEAWKPYGHHRN